MARYTGPIRSRTEFLDALTMDNDATDCGDTLLGAEIQRFMTLYDNYVKCATRYVATNYAHIVGTKTTVAGWAGNWTAMVNGAVAAGMARVAYGKEAGSDALAHAMKRGCEMTALAMRESLVASERPSGWHAMICRIGYFPGHVAAAMCYGVKHDPFQLNPNDANSPDEAVKREYDRKTKDYYKGEELTPLLLKTGYVFDPWINGKPEVYTMQSWFATVSFLGHEFGNADNLKVEEHAKPIFHSGGASG